jgi:WD40 repeat protein
MYNQARYFFCCTKLLSAVVFIFVLNGCVKQAQIPSSATDVIKHYQRLTVHATSYHWTKTNFSVNPGDYVLITASGKVTTSKKRRKGLSYHKLYMKIGKEDYPFIAFNPLSTNNPFLTDNSGFFTSNEKGRMMFIVKDWSYLSGNRPAYNSDCAPECYYRDNSGRFIVDVFVFQSPDRNLAIKTLAQMVRANPTNAVLKSHIYFNANYQLFKEDWYPYGNLLTVKMNDATRTFVNSKFQDRKIFLTTGSQIGRKKGISAVAISPNGMSALSVGNDNIIHLWEIATGNQIRVLHGHNDFITSVAYSQDGKYALSGSYDKTLGLWDVGTGRNIRLFKGHEEAITSVVFSPDGKHAISGSHDTTLRLWELDTGKQIRIFKGHLSRVNAVAISPNGKYAISGSADTTLKLWEVATGQHIRTFEGHQMSIKAVTFDSTGRFALSGSRDKTIRLWEVATGQTLKTLEGHTSGVNSLSISPDGKYVISGGADRTLRLWELDTGKQIISVKGHKESINSALFSSDGRFVISIGSVSTKLWAINTVQRENHVRLVRIFESFFKGKINAIKDTRFNPDGKYMASARSDHTIRLWEVATGRQIKILKGHQDTVNAVRFSPNGKMIISGSNDQTLRLWEFNTGKEVRIFRHQNVVGSICFSPDGKFILSVSNDNTLRVWEVDSGKEVNVLLGHLSSIKSVGFSPDGKYALSGSLDGILLLWEISTGKVLKTFRGHKDSINSVCFSPDGKYAATGSADNSVRLWHLFPNEELHFSESLLLGHFNSVNEVVFSPTGRQLVSCSDDNTIRVWDIATGKELKTLLGHRAPVYSVAFGPDGKHIISGSEDGTEYLWRIDRDQEVARFYHFENGEWIVITPDRYYDSSPEGSPLIYWVLPNDMETFSFEQFESYFKRPDIIKARLSGDLDAGKPAPLITHPPSVDMDDHMLFKKTKERSYPLNISISSPEKVKTVRIFVNGKPTLEVPADESEKEIGIDIPLNYGANRITTVAYDNKGFSSNPKYVDVVSDQMELTKPKLYVFGVGISKYPNLTSKWQLEFAHTDAKSLIKVFQNQESKLFGEVRISLLTNENATVETISQSLEALSAIDENDIAVIFMAGHGVRDENGTFYFLTSEGSFKDPKKGGLSWEILGDYLDRIKGRVILFLDACHSGSIVTETVVPNDELAQEFFTGKRGGTMVFSASKGRQYSMESPDIGGGFGIFTYALTQGLGEKAKEVDINGNNFVEFMELVEYVGYYVNKETRGEQTPWLSRKELFGDLPIAVVQ